MTNQVKRWIGVVLVSLIASLALAACGADNTPTPAAGPGGTKAPTTQAGPGTTTTASSQDAADLTVWLHAGATESGPPPNDWEVYKVVKDRLNINLKFTIIPVGPDGDNLLTLRGASNDLPDL